MYDVTRHKVRERVDDSRNLIHSFIRSLVGTISMQYSCMVTDFMCVFEREPTLSHPLRTGTFVITEGLQVGLTGITSGRLLGRYYTRVEQQDRVKCLQLEGSYGW